MDRHLVLILSCCVFLGCARDGSEDLRGALVGWAFLPADTFVDGPTSGQFIKPANGRIPPFERRQPVQGVSALIVEQDGTFLALADNGFGSKENSPDYVLQVFRFRPEFKTQGGGSGDIEWSRAFSLRDPDRLIGWPIVADADFYPESDIPLDSAISSGRLLTGADFDVESFRRLPDGTFFFGDEFGPFLLHTDSTGKLIEPPIALPGVWSPQHPELRDRAPNLPRSAGFEGMALSADGRYLYPMLEKPLEGQNGLVLIFTYDIEAGEYRNQGPSAASFAYPLSEEAGWATELVHRVDDRYLAIERDAGQGEAARFKRVFEVVLDGTGTGEILEKREVLDLLDVRDPYHLWPDGVGTFTFPYETIEALVVLTDGSFVIANDNNYPFGKGRFWQQGEPDGTEMIRLSTDRP